MKNMEKIFEGMKALTAQEQQWIDRARQMGQAAGEVLRSYFRRRDLDIEDKGSAYDIVTEADKASERLILDFLHSHFPDHAILSEESGDDHRDATYQWVIDPLDGTVNYSAGLATYCISIGLKENGETCMGYVYAPTLDEEFWAIRGKGSYGPYGRLQAKTTTELDRAVNLPSSTIAAPLETKRARSSLKTSAMSSAWNWGKTDCRRPDLRKWWAFDSRVGTLPFESRFSMAKTTFLSTCGKPPAVPRSSPRTASGSRYLSRSSARTGLMKISFSEPMTSSLSRRFARAVRRTG